MCVYKPLAFSFVIFFISVKYFKVSAINSQTPEVVHDEYQALNCPR